MVTQDGTGGRTITLPATANKVLGSTSTTSIALSTSAGAKDILNFYYDGTNCYWNIGQGYGTAATPASTNLANSVTGTLPVANGGTGATTLTGLVKGSGTSALIAAVAGTDYLAPNGSAANLTNFPTLNQNTTGNAATVTTNANLTGDVTSVGNTSTVVKINGTSLASLSTGILKNTTTTGVPTIAVAGTDYQAPISLTTTGTGAATLSGTTLNIPSVSSTVNSGSISGTIAVANGGTGATTLTGYVKGTGTTAMTASANIPVADVTGAAPLASPTFTGTVTTATINTGALTATSVNSPIYASTPQTLTDAATISWNPANGLNANVTLGGNRTLSFTSTPAVGSYGTVVLTQDGTGGRTITLPTIPSVTNKVLGSATNTTVSLSTAANAKDILNFYYDGTNCYWNIGQGYGAAATASFTLTTTGTGAATLSGTTLNIPSVSSTVNSGSISGTIAVANGGTGASTKSTAFDALSPMTASGDIIYGGTNGTGTRLAKGNNGTVLTMENNVPTWLTSIRATSGSTYNAAVGFSFLGGDWARNTGMFSDNPDGGGSATLKFRIATSNSTADPYLEISPSKVSVLPITSSTSKTTGALTVAGGLGVNGDIYASNINVSGAITGGTWSATTIAIANGGTGASTQQASINALTGTQSSGKYLRSDGTNATLANIQAADIPTLNQNTTGNASTATKLAASKNINGVAFDGSSDITISASAGTLSGTVAVANGGTGLTSTPGNGQIDIGNGSGFTRANLTPGTAITITNASGAITISAAIRPTSDEFTATAGQTAFTLTQTPLTNTTTNPVKPNVWMFINGVRTKNSAYAVSGTSVTYTASSNNSYTLVAGDRIQFDYAY